LKIFKPKSEKLKEYIEFYYFFEEKEINKKTSYLIFPLPYTVLSFVKSASLEYSKNNINIRPCLKETISFDLTTSYTKPIRVNCFGSFKEVTIVFKPLGFQSFLKNHNDSSLESFIRDGSLKLDELFDVNSNSFIDNIEEYLLSKLNRFEHPFLEDFVRDAYNGVDKIVLEYSIENKVSPKTFIKHSKLYLKRTPAEFKKVVRFHNALKEFKKKEKIDFNLTNLSLIANFFDQSHMIKDFRSLSGYTPKEFFKKVNKEKREINWMYD